MWLITTTTTNGYRCPCCYRTWTHLEWVSTIQEAMAQFPKEPSTGEDGGVDEIEIKDGSTGEIVAYGKMSWPQFDRPTWYSYLRWAGWTPDGSFEIILRDQKVVIDRTWGEIIQTLGKEAAQRRLNKAERAVEQAQANLRRVKGGEG